MNLCKGVTLSGKSTWSTSPATPSQRRSTGTSSPSTPTGSGRQYVWEYRRVDHVVTIHTSSLLAPMHGSAYRRVDHWISLGYRRGSTKASNAIAERTVVGRSSTNLVFKKIGADVNNNNIGVFILHRLNPDDNERIIITLWTEAHYI